MIEADVAVVGAGITGLSAAWRVASAGRDVVILEQHEVGHDRGSSHGPTRVFRLAYGDPLYVRMAQASLPLWDELGGTVLTVTGGVDIGEASFVEPIAHALAACGAVAEQLSPGARRERLPWLEADAPAAVWSPDTGVIVAERAVARTLEAALALGARLVENAPVERVEPGAEDVILATPGESVRARHVVVAAGAWAGPLLATLGIRVPLRVTREQVLYFGARPEAALPGEVFIHWGDVHRYGVPAFGSAPGYKMGEHGAGAEVTGTRTFDLAEPEAARLRAYVASSLPSLEPRESAFDTCLYTSTPSQDFVIDARERLVVASPCSGHGFKFAPLVGEYVAALVAGRAPELPGGRFALAAFS